MLPCPSVMGYNFIAFRSRYKGTCTTIYKARKSDNIIVSWRFEGRKYDCLLLSIGDGVY
jgi:hypothetical protein